MKERDILYENGTHWVRRARIGKSDYFEVYQVSLSGTHSVRRGSFGATLPDAFKRACDECDRRETKARAS